MRSNIVIALLLITVLPSVVIAQAQNPAQPKADQPPAAQPAPAQPAATKPAQPAAAPAVSAAAKPVTPPKRVLRTEGEIGAFTSELSDQLYARINLNDTNGSKKWFVRAGYALSKSRSYSGNNTYTTAIDTYTLDSQYRNDGEKRYKFISGTAIVRDRSPFSPVYGGKSGYYMISSGVGRSVAPGFEAEIALAGVTTYDLGTEYEIAPVSSLRWKRDLTNTLSMDTRAYILQPFGDDMLVDSRTNLTYKCSPNVSLRMTYVANNLLKPISTRSGWDKSIRVALVFVHTTK